MATSAASEQVFNMNGYVVKSRRANFRVRQWRTFSLVLLAEKEALKVD